MHASPAVDRVGEASTVSARRTWDCSLVLRLLSGIISLAREGPLVHNPGD